MHLKKIKLAGFKSFVDPTTIAFPGSLTGIVGPNGCGKSNVIDAVKWVMGESSAKSMRGEVMADVIFSGANTRKPVGAASVELVFDNRDGKLGGQYAGFGEISIKRVVSRDGASEYGLNGSRCRRRDITDVFLGTGLGPRSYAIIEQGMITRLVEAKPEELKLYLEEAAGISKYRERRRETETRIRHTRENLARLTDLREELAKRIKHLQRQAEAASKYKAFAQDERRLQAELLALRCRGLESEVAAQTQITREKETAYERAVASQRALGVDIEKARAERVAAEEAMQAAQERHYQRDADITRLEAAIKHSRENQARQQQELERLAGQLRDTAADIAKERQGLQALERRLQAEQPRLQQARQQQQDASVAYAAAETAMDKWRQQWEENQRALSQARQTAQVQATSLGHIEGNIARLDERLRQLRAEQAGLGERSLDEELRKLRQDAVRLDEREARLQSELQEKATAVDRQRADNARLADEREQAVEESQLVKADLSALQAAQNAALSGDNAEVAAWLAAQELQDAPRLAQKVSAQAGWEKAVEAALGHYLEAVCVADESAYAADLRGLENGRVSLIRLGAARQAPTDERLLLSKLRAECDLGGLLHEVYVAQDLPAALSLRERLPRGGRVVTRDGVCVGENYVHVSAQGGEEGILQREQHIKRLESAAASANAKYAAADDKLKQGHAALQAKERERDMAQTAINEMHRERAEARAEITGRESKLGLLGERAARLQADASKLDNDRQAEQAAMATTREKLQSAEAGERALQADEERLREEGESCATELDAKRGQARSGDEQARKHEARVEALRGETQSMQRLLERSRRQQRELEERKAQISQGPDGVDGADTSLAQMEAKREALLGEREQTEARLNQARNALSGVDERLGEMETRRRQLDAAADAEREHVEQARLAGRQIKGQLDAMAYQLDAQLAGSGEQTATMLARLEAGATEEAWGAKLEQLQKRIARLQPVNLAAIEEYKAASERRQYLERQNDDLNEALDTLQAAMRKIDRETRGRLKETFERVNAGMGKMFPRLFGGGHAGLELTEQDLLKTGVSVMARPPGKRNSSIHLLSGGEKAMTAIALLFSFFQLNPAPFCMLDEIDAPLDDANVARFCEVVKEMSADIQFIVVTHSKTTMAMVNQLMGVTMQEAGVSRLVSVDLDEAAQMAS